ncbi:DUF1501 domain-containing protein [Schlesneria sp. DSM 10557]|uniref:DUF1501 domain-containing protein n=1 Tax=Schlesneria sp. DSM 10557 TaxID=3044399 RepID=UPI00359F5F48
MSLRFVADDLAGLRIDRREWLRIGGRAGLGCGIASSLSQQTAFSADLAHVLSRPDGFGRAKSVVVLYASGGQSQLETWDPKPDAPEQIRGEFSSIETSIPGVRLCEYLPRMARLADQYTIIRSMSHDDLDHGSAIYLSLTGQFHPQKSSNFPPRPEDAPSLGAILHRVRPTSLFPYSAIDLNGPVLIPDLPSPGQDGGFLGRTYEPLMVGDVTAPSAILNGLEPLPKLPTIRQSARSSLLATIDRARDQLENHRSTRAMSELYRQAYTLLANPKCRLAFDLTQEPEAVRNRYGRFRSGQACLLARRLVEAEVPLITVFLNESIRGQDNEFGVTDAYGWDTHNDIFDSMKAHLLPRFDFSVSALLEDLQTRGLLDTTLVVCMGEFGRAPRVAVEPNFKGSSPGRKHWATVYSIMLAGAGVGKGHVIGASDRIGAYPESTPVSPGDVAATIFSSLGIDPSGHYNDPTGRPIPLATGRPVSELYQ